MCSVTIGMPSKAEIELNRRTPYAFDPSPELRAWMKTAKVDKSKRQSVMCQACGSVKILGSGDTLRNYQKNGVSYCDAECARDDRSRRYRNDKDWLDKWRETKEAYSSTVVKYASCLNCEKRFVSRGGSRVCSSGCKVQFAAARWQAKLDAKRLEYESDRGQVTCMYCNKTKHFETHASRRKFCSFKCSRKATKQKRDHWSRTNGPVQLIDVEKLIKNYKGRCVACGCKVTKQSGFYDPRAATIDHIVPLSKGGWHVWSNVQLMCHECNGKKCDALEPGMQLMLAMDSEASQ